MSGNTRDLSEFGHRERQIAADLLKAFQSDKDKTEFLGDEVFVEFNTESGNVFLVDECYNVAMMNGDFLEDWFCCSECGHEGFKEDMKHGEDSSECQRFLHDIGVLSDEEYFPNKL